MKKLNKKYTKTEQADAFVFRNPLNDLEKQEANSQLAEAREKLKSTLTKTQQLHARVLQLRYQMEDYVKFYYYDESMSFAHFLRLYIDLNYKTNKEFAADIDIDVTELSQLLNQHRSPSEKIIVRLELHSNNTIPALCWYKLLEKQREYALQTDNILREEQAKYVKNKLKLD